VPAAAAQSFSAQSVVFQIQDSVFQAPGKMQPGVSGCSLVKTGLCAFLRATWDKEPFLLAHCRTVGLRVLQEKNEVFAHFMTLWGK